MIVFSQSKGRVILVAPLTDVYLFYRFEIYSLKRRVQLTRQAKDGSFHEKEEKVTI